ncbi:hypothetical protein [uncultured Adlercreutzia sp.]|uniref:hypothetical protein n=1 Tax=uncultured Adlercreutzia sp. TaxID=875803 RepID=UPI0025EB2516|nr:hypothetical protein [uncultured Adlercreutzia sp.]
MGQNEDAQGSPRADAYESAGAPAGRPVPGSRGKITSRPSRESILRSYASQDEMRARDARLRSQQATRAVAASAAQRASDRAARQEALAAHEREQAALRAASRDAGRPSRPAPAQQRRSRVVPPLSSQESYDLTRSSMESYERARASRDALSESRRGRALNREVIDGRGSIDSRTFNESHQISSYSRDDRDRHDPMLDTMDSRTWHSRAGQGFVTPAEGGTGAMAPIRPRATRASSVGFSGVMSGRAQYSASQGGMAGVPLFLKVAVPVIVVLLAVIIFLLVF